MVEVEGKCGSLWFRVLAARFRKGSLFVYADNGKGSAWWCTLVSNGCSVGTTVGSCIDDTWVMVISFYFGGTREWRM